MSCFESIFGRGYDREKAYAARYHSEREDDYMVCGECGQEPHDGPCNPLDTLTPSELPSTLPTVHTSIGLN